MKHKHNPEAVEPLIVNQSENMSVNSNSVTEGDEPTSTVTNPMNTKINTSGLLIPKESATLPPDPEVDSTTTETPPVAPPVEGGVVIANSAPVVEVETVKPLSEEETIRLKDYEGVIEDNYHGFQKAGEALFNIRESGLYRRYGSFEAYCWKKWRFKRSKAYRLIDFADVVKELSPIGDITLTESQTRELVQVPKGQRAAVVDLATEEAGGKPVTAARLKKAAEQVVPALAKKKKKAKKKAKPAATEENVIPLPSATIAPIALADILTRIEQIQELLDDIPGTDAVLEQMTTLQEYVQALIDGDTRAAA